jgi:hypothetical protein
MTEMMEFFREMGKRGGKKRAAEMTAARRSAIAKKAARARWKKVASTKKKK